MRLPASFVSAFLRDLVSFRRQIKSAICGSFAMTDDEDFAIWLAGQLSDKSSADLRELRVPKRGTWLSMQLARAARLLLCERGEIVIDMGDYIPLSHLLVAQRKADRRDKQAAPRLVRSIRQERLQADHQQR